MKSYKLNEQGQGLTEYITLLVLVSLTAVAITRSLGKSVKGAIRKARDHISTQIVLKEKGSGSDSGKDSDDD